MTEFDFEVRQKKSLVPSARRKINGSRSKKCSLPSDYLKKGDLKKLNGEPKQYNLSAPMKWAEFKEVPHDLQREYLTGLREKYRASSAMLAEMLGVSAWTVLNYCDQYLGEHFLGTRQTRMHPRKKDLDAFRAWLDTHRCAAETTKPEIQPQTEPIPVEAPAVFPEETPRKGGGRRMALFCPAPIWN